MFGETRQKRVLPACFGLLPDKSSATYTKFWAELKQILDADKQVVHSPTHLLIDFERAALTGFCASYPDATPCGCFFHFRKANHTQLGQKGALVDYNQSRDFQNLVSKVLSLAFVPVDQIIPLWTGVIEPAMYRIQDNVTEEMDAHLDYFHDTYIGKIMRNGRRARPRFAHDLWSQYSNVINGIPSTNNKVEAWNAAFNRSQPSTAVLWTTIDGFKREDGLAHQKWVQDSQDAADPDVIMQGNSRRIAVKLRNERLKTLCLQFDEILDKELYLQQVSSLMNL